MMYRIAEIEDYRTGLRLSIDKSANKTVIGIYEPSTQKYSYRKFETLEEAYTVFEKLSKHIVFGEHNNESRVRILVEVE